MDEWTQQTKAQMNDIRKRREINQIMENQEQETPDEELNEHLQAYVFKNNPERIQKQKKADKEREDIK